MSMYDLVDDYEDRQLTLTECMPTWAEAKVWAELRIPGPPMTQTDFDEYLQFCSRKTTEGINKCRCRTTLGWYLSLWFNWIVYFCEAILDYPSYKFLTQRTKGTSNETE